MRIPTFLVTICLAAITASLSQQSAPAQNPILPPTVTTNVDSRIAGKKFSAVSSLWSTRDDTTSTYVWNKDCWLRGINMTCVSPWNSKDGPKATVTLITPDAVIGAKHYNPRVGARVRFIGPDNKCYVRTIMAEANPGSDIWIGLLDSPLPPAITPVKCLPPKFPLAMGPNEWRAPICGLNQYKEAFVCDFAVATLDGMLAMRQPNDSQRNAFFAPLILGDSGSPYFFIINDEAILLGCWWSSIGGPSVQYYQRAINEALSFMGSRYKLQAASF